MEKIIEYLKSYQVDSNSDFSIDEYLLNIPDPVEKVRLQSYKHYLNYFEGNIINYVDSIEGERPYSNIISNFVYKINGWLLQEDPQITSKFVSSEIVDELINEIFENSDNNFISDVLFHLSVYGDCFVKVCLDSNHKYLMKDNLYSFKFKIPALPNYVFAEYDANNELFGVLILYPDLVYEVEGKQKLYFQYWTKESVYCSVQKLFDESFYLEKLIEDIYKERGADENLKGILTEYYKGVYIDDKKSPFYDMYAFQNIYREIPFIHFRNLNFLGKSYGISDIRNLTVVARERTSLMNFLKDVVSYQGNPILMVKGMSVNSNPILSADRLLTNVPENAEISFIPLNIGDLDKLFEMYNNILKEEISGSGLPFDFLVSSSNFISGDSSASALKLKFNSLLILLVLKKKFIENSFEKLLGKALRFFNDFNKLGLETVMFPESYTAKKFVNFNENISDKIFNVYLDSVEDDVIIKSVIEEIQQTGADIKPEDVLEVLASLDEEYKKKYDEAMSYIEKASLNRENINKLLKIRSVPFDKVGFLFKNFLPHSRRQIIDDLEVELRNNIESISGALERLGVKNPDKKIDEILRDSQILGTIKGIIDKHQQMELLDVEKIRRNSELIQQIQSQTLQQQGYVLDDEGNIVQQPTDAFQNPITDRVIDDKGGRGRVKIKENPQKVEDKTSQSAESVIDKRKEKSQN